jgi:hypothetical protein
MYLFQLKNKFMTVDLGTEGVGRVVILIYVEKKKKKN